MSHDTSSNRQEGDSTNLLPGHARTRVFGIWEHFATFPRLVGCFYKAASSKLDRESVLRFYSNLETEIFTMREELLAGRYRWGAYRSFWVRDPKLRRIESAPFRDRVVHHAIHQVIEPIFDPCFYDHSYACRSGRGTHAAVRRLHGWISERPSWHYLQMDVSKYFPSIDRKTLYGLIEAKIGDPKILALICSLLVNAPGERGIPIGNLTSQLFANLYLNPLDHFIKRRLRVPYYVRYMDDFVLLAPGAEELSRVRAEVEDFADTRLGLRFHPHKIATGPVRGGISFVGYRLSPWGIALRGKSLRRFRKKLRRPAPLDTKVRTFLSYQGHVKHASQPENLLAQLREIAFRGEAFMT